MQKNIGFVRCEAVAFEVLKTCVYLAMAYLLVVRAWFFVICTVKGLPQLFYCLLDKSWRGTSRMSLQNRWEPRSSSQLQGQKMLSEGRVRRTHTYSLYFLPAFMGVSPHRYRLVILIPLVFFVFFFLPLDANRLRGEISFRPKPLRKPPYEPSYVDIQFYNNLKKEFTQICR